MLQLLPAPLESLSGDAAHVVRTIEHLAGGSVSGETARMVVHYPLLLALRGLPDTDIIHAVGSALLAVARTRSPVFYSPEPFPTDRELRLLRILAHRVPLYALTTTAYARAALDRTGIRWTGRFVLPPVPAEMTDSPPPTVSRDAIRKKLGLGPDDRAVLAVGPSSRNANHLLALWGAAILSFVDPRWRLLLLGEGAMTPQLERIAGTVGSSGNSAIFVADRIPGARYQDLLPAADFAIDTSDHLVDTCPLAQTLVAGLPLLATPSLLKTELLPRNFTLTAATPRAIARRLLDLTQNDDLLSASRPAVLPQPTASGFAALADLLRTFQHSPAGV